MRRATLSFAAAVAVVVAVWPTAGPAAAAPGQPAAPKAGHPVRRACSDATPVGVMHCNAMIRTDTAGRTGVLPNVIPSGYGPADLQSAYVLPSGSGGSGQTVAIVDAQDLPTAESDLATYRAQYGLPPCTTANGPAARRTRSRSGCTSTRPRPPRRSSTTSSP